MISEMNFSPNLIADLQQMLQYQFMQHAFEAGTMISIMAGVVGYFVVVRRSAFAAHALSHIGFAGAAGAVVLGVLLPWVTPIYGLLAFTIIGGITMTVLAPRAAQRDTEIGIVLAFMLGLGVLFISLYTGYATEAYSILFGEILGISSSSVLLTVAAGLGVILAVSIVYRPLLFSSLDENVAEAKGLPTFWLGVVFMLLLAIATSFAVEVVGVLLIFSLMVTPAATALHLASRPGRVLLVSVLIALFSTWAGLFIAFYTPYPVSFFITAISFSIYLLVRRFHHHLKIGPSKAGEPIDHAQPGP